MAEAHNPATRIAWEGARAQLAALGIARSELFPTLAAIALSQINRGEALLGDRFYRQTVQTFEGALDLSYIIFDFGARSGRIEAARAQLLAANFAFNETLIGDIHDRSKSRKAETSGLAGAPMLYNCSRRSRPS